MKLRSENIRTLHDGGRWQECFEGAYLQNFFDDLELFLGADFKKWTFHVLHHNLAISPIEFPFFGKKHVLIWLSDESGGRADYAAARFEHVFKAYALPPGGPPNLHPFPIFGVSTVLLQQPLPFVERGHQVFFSGNLNRARADLFLRLKFPLLDDFPCLQLGQFASRSFSLLMKVLHRMLPPTDCLDQSYIRFTDGFAKGLSSDKYASTLAASQICLCPAGFISAETMRHFEAMRLGCVIVSEMLPDGPYYFGSPIIQRPSWRGIRKAIKSLLQDQDALVHISDSTEAWWRNHCSPRSAARSAATILMGSP